VVANRGIVEAEWRGRNFLNRGNDVGQEREHLLHPDLDARGAVEVQREIADAEVGLDPG